MAVHSHISGLARLVPALALIAGSFGGRPVPEYADQVRLTYDVVKNHKVVGQLYAWRNTVNETVGYKTESSVKVDIIFSIKVYSLVEGVFSKGQLTEGKILRKVNGNEKANAHIVWSKDKYFIREPDKTFEFKPRIYYSTACLMHQEPVNVTQVFSENYKKFLPLRKIAPNKYELKLPDGNTNYYLYQSGICTEAKVSTNLATVYFRLRK